MIHQSRLREEILLFLVRRAVRDDVDEQEAKVIFDAYHKISMKSFYEGEIEIETC